MTTVGYGDISPQTDEGRVLAMIVMLVGIGFLTMVIGAASERFIQRDLDIETREVEMALSQDLEPVLVELRRLHERLESLESELRAAQASTAD
jgi:voltage-gated potassium channel